MSQRNYKVLIADDEYWSRENIKNLISWETYSMTLLPPAKDGEEVQKRVAVEKPDILLTDINMPFVDGLELLQWLSVHYPDIITVAISGYDDFRKVKGVFTLGGIDYLLKPVERSQLVDVLRKAINLIEEREMTQNHSHRISSFIEDNEFSSILNGKLYETYRQGGPSREMTDYVPTVLLKFHNISWLSRKYGNDMLAMSVSIKKVLREIFKDENTLIFNYYTKVNEFLICTPVKLDRLKILAQKVTEAFPESEGPITIVIRNRSTAQDTMEKVYREMITAMMQRHFSSRHEIILCTRENSPDLFGPAPFSRDLERNLIAALHVQDEEKSNAIIFEKGRLAHLEEDGRTLMELSQFLARIRELLWGSEHAGDVSAEFRDEIDETLRFSEMSLNKEVIFDNIRLAVHVLCQKKKKPAAGSAVEQVELIRQEISEQYFEHFDLPGLGEKYHIEPSYLSRMFSAQYGESITAYIARIRIEKAIELMKSGSQNLEAISFEVGYDDYNYFSRVFKKKTGLRPTEYRKKLEDQ